MAVAGCKGTEGNHVTVGGPVSPPSMLLRELQRRLFWDRARSVGNLGDFYTKSSL